MKTQAALLVQTGQPLVLAEIETPALKPGQVLVEIAYSGACGTQVMEWRGDKGEDKWVPHCLGHEGTGTVIEAGSAVTKVKVGDKVVLSWIKGTGIEAGGAVYDWDGKKVNAGGVTTFQRHAVVSENRLTLLPPDLPMDVAVLLGCAAPTGMGAVYNVLKVQPGDAVAVFGTGGIGLNALMAAALAGAMPVIGIDPNPTRRALAQIYGATHVIDASGDVLAEIKKIVPQGVDLAVESSGIPAVMEQAINATRQQGGRAVVIGNAKHGAVLSLNPGVFNQGKSLLGTWGGDSMPDRDYGRYGRLLNSGRFPVRDLLSKPYSLAQADQALQDLAAGKVGRPLIDMSLR
ncbi:MULTISPECIES: zinc-binding dehydrogenase [Bradyrhizobium]|jgi:S-(hydroxymethyl)glutathione dehydrogenase/alcohol dehydrogenase|uniref:Zinc-binding dehydrogenase n=6 Tax=Bradyrhizobium TaxID=374 RepID=A0ABS5G705_9BRAD|nr:MULTISPECIES: zinc-binding dehydrogenase [Bradyrhizobium]ABQ37596.1 Putative alcohol dehydrogenase (Zinc-binding) [Bradyrhizobium sp. BTAi1]MBR1137097.1 zinc-binding dehydrogenase [Bradyrhizobium denitrificans]MDU0954501.1 zinc-binding dehydrogenase [Bradyrhizobium sp.]MDU1495566.1 zinc-binding dehydrogenase [Bradyrhizobium sp.]MDU1542483.1 zinc-binding dehydrogenase [Bradyrhizobium sp.]